MPRLEAAIANDLNDPNDLNLLNHLTIQPVNYFTKYTVSRMNRLFCYGTLQVPEVIQAVIGRTYESRTAILHGYAIYRVKNAEYPGIVRSADSVTEGIIYEKVKDSDLKVLDLFEGEFYNRQLLDVRLSDGGAAKVWCYVIADHYKDILTDQSWNLEDFLDIGLEKFMEGYVTARRNIYRA